MSARNEARGVPAVQTRGIGDWIKLGIGVIGAIALIVFFAQNLQEVQVDFLWFEWTTGLIWALLASAIVGALSAVAFATIQSRRRPPR